jgi:glycosyltransferase involved in cell wall biosynthesis
MKLLLEFIGEYSDLETTPVALARELLSSAGEHDVHVLLNVALPEAALHYRQRFSDLLTPDKTHYLDISPMDQSDGNFRWLYEELRTEVLFEIDADFVLTLDFMGGAPFDRQSIPVIGHYPGLSGVLIGDFEAVLSSDLYQHSRSLRDLCSQRSLRLLLSDLVLSVPNSPSPNPRPFGVPCTGQVLALEKTQVEAPVVHQVGDSVMACREATTIVVLSKLDGACAVDRILEAFPVIPQASEPGIVSISLVAPTSDQQARARELGAGHLPLGQQIECFSSLAGVSRAGRPVQRIVLSPTADLFGCLSESLRSQGHIVCVGLGDLGASMGGDAHAEAQYRELAPVPGSFPAIKLDVARVFGVIQGLIEKRGKPSRKPKPKLAYLSPLPPEKYGIAIYSGELLPYLSKHYTIELVSENPAVGSELVTCFRVRDYSWFEKNFRSYDRVLYHFGNSPAHRAMFALIEKVPGVIVLHDFFLIDAIRFADAHGYFPGLWTKSLFLSHGYRGIVEGYFGTEDLKAGFPASLGVIQSSLGTIVHSDHSKELGAQWFGPASVADWATIPLLRKRPQGSTREASRRELGLEPDQFVVCSFGFLTSNKLNLELVEAWALSELARSPDCLLVFVGELQDGNYGDSLLGLISKLGLGAAVRITGWVDGEDYRRYLESADLAVQLRTKSRGETSATVLDCLNYGIATIVNANGSFAYLDESAVCMLPDRFSVSDLAASLSSLYGDGGYRTELEEFGLRLVQTLHAPESCAALYHERIESFYTSSPASRLNLVRRTVMSGGRDWTLANKDALDRLLSANLASNRRNRRILVDVSSIARTDLKTGIERVVRQQILGMVAQCPGDWRVEPVYLTDEGGYWHYRYAREYTLALYGYSSEFLRDDEVIVAAGDVFYAPDFFRDGIIEAGRAGLFQWWAASGVRILFLVHDLLPLLRPDFFPPLPAEATQHEAWLSTIAKWAESIICVSAVVARDVREWIASREGTYPNKPQVVVLHHGADIREQADEKLTVQESQLLDQICTRPTFLMVGTIEPRKGHIQAIGALELLWRKGVDVNLVVVGKEGWKNVESRLRRSIPETIRLLQDHAEAGKRLQWLQAVSDAFLESLYRRCQCLLFASEGEGFGLPIIEASQYSVPLLLRDLPVFHEIAGTSASYFSGLAAEDLAASIEAWLDQWRSGDVLDSSGIKLWSWKENTQALLGYLTCRNPYFLSNLHLLSEASDRLHSVRKRRIFVDVSVTARKDFKTGIQRVVRALTLELLSSPPPGYEVEGVYMVHEKGSWFYRSIGIQETLFADGGASIRDDDAMTEFRPGDWFLGLDLAGGYVVNADRQILFERLKMRGVFVSFVVYDLIPVRFPQFYSPDDSKGHADWIRAISTADALIAISRTVEEDLREWLTENRLSIPMLLHFRLGADLTASAPSSGLPTDIPLFLREPSNVPVFLMVGTIEPRKGYREVLEIFDLAWKSGESWKLVLVGRGGWLVDDFLERLSTHEQMGTNLHWFNEASDEFLELAYKRSTVLLAASFCEGFGLPLIEAEMRNLPVIARDIPIFREVGREYPTYFDFAVSEKSVEKLRTWLNGSNRSRQTDSSRLNVATSWKESAASLVSQLISVAQGNRERNLGDS